MYIPYITLFLILVAVILYASVNASLTQPGLTPPLEGFETLSNTVSGNVYQKNGLVFVNGAVDDVNRNLGGSSAIIGKGWADSSATMKYLQSIGDDSKGAGTFVLGGPQLWIDSQGVPHDNVFFLYWRGVKGRIFYTVLNGTKMAGPDR